MAQNPQPSGGGPSGGKALFVQYCSACHGKTGEGGVGAPLSGASSRKSREQVVAFIKNPKAPMPKLYPSPLTESDVASVAEFVETLK